MSRACWSWVIAADHGRVLVAVREVGGGLTQDVGEGVGREDLLEQRGVLGPVRFCEAYAQCLAACLQVVLATGQLLLQQSQREVGLLQVLDERGVPSLGAREGSFGTLDLGLHACQVSIDLAKLPLRGGDGRLRRGLIAAEVAQQRLGPGDRASELLLPLPGSFDLIRKTGAEGWQWRRRQDREEDDESKDDQSWKRQRRQRVHLNRVGLRLLGRRRPRTRLPGGEAVASPQYLT